MTGIKTANREKLLALLFRGEVRFPLDIGERIRVERQHRAGEILAQARGLDRRAVRALLMAAIAERLSR